MAKHQVSLMVVVLQIAWRKYFGRDGVLSQKDFQPGKMIDVQDSTTNESVVSLREDIDKTNTEVHDLKEIIENLNSKLERIETRIQREIERRANDLENK